MDQLVNFIIRPPRADYRPKEDLLESEFLLRKRWFQRRDLEVVNGQGKKLQCSHYMPLVLPEGKALPCVIYCHGNSGCRADASEAAIILLPSNITVFTLDFSGSGLSEGEHVTLGWNEKEDLRAVVNYLRTDGNVSCIGLWGRSMGAVTSLMYGAEDPSIAGMVLDSPFSNLVDLMMELVDTYKYPLPKFTVKFAIQHMRKVINKKANFEIMDLDTIKVAQSSFVPALFGHATDDDFIPPHHSEHIFESYVGDKNIIKFDGDHNSPRPQFYFDSVTIFFHNVLNPPSDIPDYIPTAPNNYDQGLWDSLHDVEYRFRRPPSARPTAATEYDIAQLRSRRLMSRMEVPSGSSSLELGGVGSEKEGADGDLHPSSSSALASNGPNERLPFSGIDDDDYVEYSFDSLSDLAYNVEDEDRMLMQAILASLKDVQINNTKDTESSGATPSSEYVSPLSGTESLAGLLEADKNSDSPTSSDVSSKDVQVDNPGSKFVEVPSINNPSDSDLEKTSDASSSSGTQDVDAADGTRATLLVQSRTGSLMEGLSQKWGNLFKNSG